MVSDINVDKIPKLVVVGHVDHGKSSFIGRLIFDLGLITKSQTQELKKN